MNKQSVRISYNHEILLTRGVTPQGIIFYANKLSEFLKDRFLEVVPVKIDSVQALDRILNLYEILSDIHEINGYKRHAIQYTESQFLSTLFVAKIARFLKPIVDNIELEPVTKKQEGNPDIKIEKNGVIAYIECKNIETSQFNDLSQHRTIFEILDGYIDVPHQISFSYKKMPTDTELHKLGCNIKALLTKITTTGNIIHNDNYEVNVQIREDYGDPRVVGLMDMIIEDTNSGDRKPAHVFLENGKTISINGPEIDYKKVIQSKIKEAKNQNISDCIFITVINTDLMLGNTKRNIRNVESLFQPDLNTRYSSVVLASSSAVVGDGNWSIVSNPFAKFPLTSEMELLFNNRMKKSITKNKPH